MVSSEHLYTLKQSVWPDWPRGWTQVSLLDAGHGYGAERLARSAWRGAPGAERPRGARSRRGAAAYGVACLALKSPK